MSEKTISAPQGQPKKSYELPTYITRSMRVLEKLSPNLASRFALYLFFRPLNFPLPEREKPIRNQANRLVLNTGSTDFTAYQWGPKDSKQILLVHGWSGRGTQFFKLIPELLDQGYRVCALDAPGHGDSPKRSSSMPEFVDAIEVTVREFGDFDYAIGHSLGGMAIFNALKRNLKVKGVVTIGTPDNIGHVVNDFCEKVHASSKIGLRIVEHIEKRFSIKISEASTDQLAKEFNPRGLIVHDEEDEDVGVENAISLIESWPNANLLMTRGLGHRRVLSDQDIINSIISFVN